MNEDINCCVLKITLAWICGEGIQVG